MSLPTERELKDVIVRILTRARDEGRLGELTVRIVLEELAKHYGIEKDLFQSKSYKPFIKATVHATVASFENASDADTEPHQPKEGKAKKSDGTVKAGKRKRSSMHSSNEEPPRDVDASEGEAPSSRKSSARSKPSKARDNQAVEKPAKPTSKASKKRESELEYKSKAIVESSDEGAVPGSGSGKSVRSPKKEKTSVKSISPKQKQQRKVSVNDSDVEMDIGEGAGPSSSSSKVRLVPESPISPVSNSKELVRDLMESELSSVVDEPQTKRKKKLGKAPTKPQKEGKAKRGKKEPLSKDEETVNKLKTIVLSCGVRKVWKKEFEGLDRPSQQIKRLHSILGDLGMTPRYSLEKAKAIREERELAQELKDVQEFDKAIKRRGKGARGSSETAEPMGQGDSDGSVLARKKQNARASIMAFLQDQSEEE